MSCAATPGATRARRAWARSRSWTATAASGRSNTVFFDTLLDENAASHIAIGQAYAFTAGEEDRERINSSAIHIDFMIGSPDVDTFGIDADGAESPLLVGGVWKV